MTTSTLDPALFFDLSACGFSDLFSVSAVYEALGKHLEAYIQSHVRNEHSTARISPLAYIDPSAPVWIGEGTVVEPFVVIKGPTIIGKNCEIRHGAYIRGNVITGDHCVIGHTTEIKNSIMLSHAKAAHFAYVGDSILGSHVNLGAGTRLANLKLNDRPITVRVDGKKVTIPLRKLGAILGDHTQTGCNSVLAPGTILGKSSVVYPAISVRGYHPENSVIK